MKNCCVLLTMLLAFFMLPEGMQAQEKKCSEAEMAKCAKMAKCNPAECAKVCDISKCTPEQLAACKAKCAKMAAKTSDEKATGTVVLASDRTNVSKKTVATTGKKCCASKKSACSKSSAKAPAKSTKLAVADKSAKPADEKE